MRRIAASSYDDAVFENKIGGAGRQFRRHAAMATKEGARRTTDIDLSVVCNHRGYDARISTSKL